MCQIRQYVDVTDKLGFPRSKELSEEAHELDMAQNPEAYRETFAQFRDNNDVVAHVLVCGEVCQPVFDRHVQ
jgi:hypothetical protein